MPKSQKLEAILNEARQREKEYDWIVAAKFYKKGLDVTLGLNDLLKAGELCEEIGFCYRRAVMQADNTRSFTERVTLAIEAYEKAASLYEELKGKQTEAYRCLAIAYYAKYWLVPTSIEKKKLLNKYHKLKTKVFKLYEKAHDRVKLGKAYNELLMCLCESDSDRATLEWDWSEREKMMMESLMYGEKAIITFSELGEDYELAKAYALTGKLYGTAGHVFEIEEETKKDYGHKSLEYLQTAFELCEKVGDDYFFSWLNIWLGISTADWAGNLETSLKCFKEAMRRATKIRDRYLIGHTAHCLAYVANWMSALEQDPGKRKQGFKKAIKLEEEALRNFHASSFVPFSFWILPESYSSLAQEEVNLEAKIDFLEKSVKVGRESLKYAMRSGYFPRPDWGVYHGLSKALYYLSTVKAQHDEKIRLCEEALKYREESVRIVEQATPFDHWNRGVFRNYLALVNAELATIEAHKLKKQNLLEKAVRSMQNCLESCFTRLKISPKASLYVTVGNYHENYAKILNQLHSLTEDPETLRKAIKIYEGAIEAYDKVGWHSYIAKTHWQIATLYNKLDKHLEAAKNFQTASKKYRLAADKTVPLKGFYQDHASYMQAWNEIEKARHHHTEKRYGHAKEHYEKAANLHKSTERWNYLSPNYLAWARLEEAEDLSRGERTEEARDLFQQAAGLFVEAKKSIKVKLEKIEVRDEKEMAAEMIKASDIREEYCLGRIALEEAKILDRHGDYTASSKKYGLAAELFQNIAKAESVQSRRELKPIIYLCQAWQKMMMAEAKASPTMYGEAAELFKQAKEHTLDQPTSLLALAHSSFCKALEAGTKFEITRDMTMYLTAKKHMEAASNYYLKAGFKNASEYARGTHRLFDAYIYMHKAETETEPRKKAQYYQMAEKLLQASAGSYMKAKHPEKSEEVRRILESVKEERQLAMSLTEVLHVPTASSTTTSFSTPTPTHEKAVGLEKFEHAAIEANLVLSSKEAKAGEDFNLEMQIANVGKEAALLAKVEEILPPGFEPVAKPDYCRFEDAYLDMKGKKLNPLKTEEVRLVLRSFDKGTFTIKPRIIYVDETGHQMSCEPEPVTINLSEVILPGRITTGYKDLDNLLFGGIPKNYAVILTSPSCDEKDLLIKRFLEAGAKDGQITFYVTIEASGVCTLAEEFESNFYLFICNPQADTMIKSLSNVFKLKGVENLTDISIALTSALRELDASLREPRRACIEIISDVLLQHHAVSTRRWLTGLIPDLRSRGFTALAIINPQMHSPEEVQAILGLFEGEINIYEKETKRGLEKFLKVKKMYNQRYLESELSLRRERLRDERK